MSINDYSDPKIVYENAVKYLGKNVKLYLSDKKDKKIHGFKSKY